MIPALRWHALSMLTLAAALLPALAARGQDAASPLRLEGLIPTGPRESVTEAWGALAFTVENCGPEDRLARALVFYPERPDVQYGRDVWVPRNATLSSWLLAGPAPKQSSAIGRNLKYLVYDRTDGPRILSRYGEGNVPARLVPYHRREPTTAILLDESATDADAPARPLPDSPAGQALRFALAFRAARGLSERITIVRDPFLPPVPEAFDGIDHVILAGHRLDNDPVGQSALRRWVELGGTLWVMLDMVDADALAPFLGNDLGCQIVDRTSLTTIRLRHVGTTEQPVTRKLDQPVDFVRVVLPGGKRILHTINGWPAAFARPLGRGHVVVTTLAGPAWYRPRTGRDPVSPFEHAPDLPMPLSSLVQLSAAIQPEAPTGGLHADDLAPLLTAEIGYSVVGVRTAAVVFAALVVALVVLGLGLRRTRRPEWIGLLGPAVALMAAGVFVALGESSRRAVPPTEGGAALVDAVPGSSEAAASGLYAVYRPQSGPVPLGSERGGLLDLDTTGLQGQVRRRIQTDLGAWHWEDFALPAGVRLGPFRASIRTGRLSARAHFGPNGVEGQFIAEQFQGPGDAIIVTAAEEPVAVRFGADGTFTAGTADVLPPGQFLASAVLTDEQQRRQAVYRQLLTDHHEDRDLLLAWAGADELPFGTGGEARRIGTALLAVPLKFDRPPAGTRITVPRGFIPYKRVIQGALVQPGLQSPQATTMELRFQLPPSVLPLTIEWATLFAQVRAPGRKFTVAGLADGKTVPLREVESPFDPMRVTIADARLLKLDAGGGLHLSVALGTRAGSAGGTQPNVPWHIAALALEIVGRTAAER